MKVVAFVPIRLNSKRIQGKNLRILGGKPLLRYIFETLISVKEINEVYAFCSSASIVQFLPEKVIYLQRGESLDNDFTLGKEIYESFCKMVNADVYVLAHATSPFLKYTTITNALKKVLNDGYDSSFSVQRFKTFAWFKGAPLNYNLSHIPRTQDIEPIYVETSAFFIFKKEVWFNKTQRIGENPYLQVLDPVEGVDIDNPEDLEFAEMIIKGMK